MERNFSRRGQSLIELLIAIVVGTVMVVAATTVIAPALKSNTDVSRTQVAVALGKELSDNVRSLAEGEWNRMLSLSTTSANHYYLNVSSSPFSAVSGDETVMVGTSTFTRYFYLEEVCRDGSGYITTCGTNYDPSTKKLTVVYGPTGKPTSTVSTYLTRHRNKTFMQTDWFGGENQAGPVTSTNSKFASSSNIIVTSTPGSVLIDL